MHIHKPHAAKTWREFLVEIGTIVIGILIALALDQTIVSLHERRNSAEAREAVRGEIAVNLASMVLREAAEPCIDRRLNELGRILDAARANKSFPPPRWIGRPPTVRPQSRRWTLASQSGRASQFSNDEQASYAAIYYGTDLYGSLEDGEQASWATLRSMEGLRTLSPAMIYGFGVALSQARYENWRIKLTRSLTLDQAATVKIRPGTLPPVRTARTQSVCVAIGTGRETALRIIDNPFGEP